jgi:hypothetical protein
MHAQLEDLKKMPSPLSEAVPLLDAWHAAARPSRFHDVWPVTGLLFAAGVNVIWIAVLGYGLFRLVF